MTISRETGNHHLTKRSMGLLTVVTLCAFRFAAQNPPNFGNPLARRQRYIRQSNRGFNMIRTLTVLVLTALVGCTASLQPGSGASSPNPDNSITIYENNKSGVGSIISNKALESFNEKYLPANENKAFAQSLSGAWDWRSNRTSVDHAKTSALVGCQRNNEQSEDLYPCRIINVNGEWVE